jgi:CBS domain containing-hemolysin-like protein
MSNLTCVVVMLACLVMSGFFSATETAFSTLNRTRVKTQADKGSRRAALVCKLSDDYDRLISSILIGNNIVNIALASIATILFVRSMGDAGATVSTAVVTVAVLIFGEVSPKSIAKDCPEKFAAFAAPVIQFLIWVFMPVNYLFSLWKKMLSHIFRVKGDSKLSQEELLMFVEEVEQGGSIDTGEGDLLRNAIEFTDLRAEDILTHRVNLEGFPKDASKQEISHLFYETKFSRLLVYDENIDHIVGVLHQKDFYTENGITDRPIEELMTPPLFVHKTEKIRELLKLLQVNKSHIAVVIDEYGGTLGIVTMEDILEELVGEIWDEHDEVVESIHKTGEDTYRVDCTVSMDDFCDYFDTEIKSDSVSVGGWITEVLDKIPSVGDSFTSHGFTVTVTEADVNHPISAQVVRHKPEEEASDEDERQR